MDIGRVARCGDQNQLYFVFRVHLFLSLDIEPAVSLALMSSPVFLRLTQFTVVEMRYKTL